MIQRTQRQRGFTLVELLTATAIIGLILLLIGYEFDASLTHLLHTQSNRDAESNARVIMTKVANHVRTATPDVYLVANPDTVIVSPIPSNAGTTSNVLLFYRVRPGSLVAPNAIPTPGGAPHPAYDLVTIRCQNGCSPSTPDQLIETVVDAESGVPITPASPPPALGHDVTGFSVTAIGSPNGDSAQINITLTVASRSVRCDPTCFFTTSNSIWVGGTTVLNE